MNYQTENQTSQLPQNNLLTPPVLYRSIANERIYDDDVTLPQVQNSTDLPVIYRSIANERIYDDNDNDNILLPYQPIPKIQHPTNLPVLVRSSANERIYDNDDEHSPRDVPDL